MIRYLLAELDVCEAALLVPDWEGVEDEAGSDKREARLTMSVVSSLGKQEKPSGVMEVVGGVDEAAASAVLVPSSMKSNLRFG